MWPDQISNPGPLTYESGALPIALCGPATAIITSGFLTLKALFLLHSKRPKFYTILAFLSAIGLLTQIVKFANKVDP